MINSKNYKILVIYILTIIILANAFFQPINLTRSKQPAFLIQNNSEDYMLWKQSIPGDVREILVPNNSSINKDMIYIPNRSYHPLGLNRTSGNVEIEFDPLHSYKNESSDECGSLIDINGDGCEELVTAGKFFQNQEDKENYFPTGSIQVYNTTSGEIIWQKIYIGEFFDELCISNSNSSQKTILTASEFIENVTEGFNYQIIRLYNSSNGDILWTKEYYKTALYDLKFADLTQDGIDDIIIPLVPIVYSGIDNNSIVAYDGSTFSLLWIKDLFENSIWDIQLFDVTKDSIIDLICTFNYKEIKALDGTSGEILWEKYEGSHRSTFYDIDEDDELEVITSFFDTFYALDAVTGELELEKDLNISHDSTKIKILDLDNDGEVEIVSSSFYGGVIVLNTTFDLLVSFDYIPFPYSLAFTDVNNDGYQDILAGTVVGDHSAVYAFDYFNAYNDSLTTSVPDDPSDFPSFSIFIVSLSIIVLIFYRKKSKEMLK